MWTVCWTDSTGFDHYERLTKPEAIELLKNLKRDLGSLEDVLVFPSEAEIKIDTLLQ